MGYSRLDRVLAGNSLVIGLGLGKVIRASTALVGEEDAVESVGAHLASMNIHHRSYGIWNSLPYTGLRN